MKSPAAGTQRFLTAVDIAAELQVSRDTAYRLMREMLHVKHRGILRVSRASFETFIRQREKLGWQDDSTNAAASGGAGTTKAAKEHAHQHGAKTNAPPKLFCVNGNAVPPIRITQPRTRPRSEKRSEDS